jgi:putative effector of murein hydrolase
MDSSVRAESGGEVDESKAENGSNSHTGHQASRDEITVIKEEQQQTASGQTTRRNSRHKLDIPPYEDPDDVPAITDRRDEETECDDAESNDDAVERLSAWISDLITPAIYFTLFLIGLPLFFVLDIGLLLFLGVNILTFIAAITIVPSPVRRFLHPILTCSITTVLIIWAFAAMKGIGLQDCLNRYYSIDVRYHQLWSPAGYQGGIPGAGDVLISTLDAGIVALAIPMYRYRRELKENIVRMMIVLTACASLSLFFWNWIAALMGMDEVRSLAFTARFMSTPLAIELAENVGADESITVILVVITGILAAILKDYFFRMMRVDREDYLIVGLTMGSTAGAIGASSLISTPKVMAVASLSFVIFGSLLLIATAIPPIVDVVRMLA